MPRRCHRSRPRGRAASGASDARSPCPNPACGTAVLPTLALSWLLPRPLRSRLKRLPQRSGSGAPAHWSLVIFVLRNGRFCQLQRPSLPTPCRAPGPSKAARGYLGIADKPPAPRSPCPLVTRSLDAPCTRHSNFCHFVADFKTLSAIKWQQLAPVPGGLPGCSAPVRGLWACPGWAGVWVGSVPLPPPPEHPLPRDPPAEQGTPRPGNRPRWSRGVCRGSKRAARERAGLRRAQHRGVRGAAAGARGSRMGRRGSWSVCEPHIFFLHAKNRAPETSQERGGP